MKNRPDLFERMRQGDLELREARREAEGKGVDTPGDAIEALLDLAEESQSSQPCVQAQNEEAGR
jgi:hypothetical protein